MLLIVSSRLEGNTKFVRSVPLYLPFPEHSEALTGKLELLIHHLAADRRWHYCSWRLQSEQRQALSQTALPMGQFTASPKPAPRSAMDV